MYKITPPSSSASMRAPIHVELARFKRSTKLDDPPQDVDKSHLIPITNLDVSCSLLEAPMSLF